MNPLRSLNNWRESHLLLADAIIAVLAVVVPLVAFSYYMPTDEMLKALQGNRATFHGALAALFGSLLGFVLAAVAIILAFGNLPRLDILRNSGHYRMIFDIFFYATNVLAVGTVWSLVALVVDNDTSPKRTVTMVTLIVSSLSFASVYRCIWVLRKVVEIASLKPDQQQPPKD